MLKKNKNSLLFIIVISNILFIALIIYKRSYITHLDYLQQSLTKELDAARKETAVIQEQLLVLQKPEIIKKFCKKELKLNDMHMKQLKKLNNGELYGH